MNHRRPTSTEFYLLGISARRQPCYSYILLLFALSAIIWWGSAQADARLMISPTRIVFEGASRTAEVNLINSGNSSGTFRISFVRKQMTEDGAYIDMRENESGMFADPYIRYAPRQVTLTPGQSQTVRVMLRKPGDLPEGEYRSHMLFQAIPDASTTDISQQVQGNRSSVTVRLIPIVGITIPVIVRQGKLEATAALSQLSYQRKEGATAPSITMMIERSGNKSIYGDLIVKFRPMSGGQEFVVGLAKGIAVYTPNKQRKFTVVLRTPEMVDLVEGELEIDYRQPETEGGELLATAVIPIGR